MSGSNVETCMTRQDLTFDWEIFVSNLPLKIIIDCGIDPPSATHSQRSVLNHSYKLSLLLLWDQWPALWTLSNEQCAKRKHFRMQRLGSLTMHTPMAAPWQLDWAGDICVRAGWKRVGWVLGMGCILRCLQERDLEGLHEPRWTVRGKANTV